MPVVLRIKKRADFLKAQKYGKSAVASGLVLQVVESNSVSKESPGIKIGFTATKKVGNAVRRNRIKRRLRAVAREVIPECAAEGYDYVLIGRHSSAERDFQSLIKDLKYTLHNTGTYQKSAPKKPGL